MPSSMELVVRTILLCQAIPVSLPDRDRITQVLPQIPTMLVQAPRLPLDLIRQTSAIEWILASIRIAIDQPSVPPQPRLGPTRQIPPTEQILGRILIDMNRIPKRVMAV